MTGDHRPKIRAMRRSAIVLVLLASSLVVASKPATAGTVEIENILLSLINSAKANLGRTQLIVHSGLRTTARNFSSYLAAKGLPLNHDNYSTRIANTTPDPSEPSPPDDGFGYGCENVAFFDPGGGGATDTQVAQTFYNGWYNSTSGHKECMLDSNGHGLNVAGVGVYKKSDGTYWGTLDAQVDSTPPSPTPVSTSLVSPSGSNWTNPITYKWTAVSNSTWYYLWVDRGGTNVVKKWFSASDAHCSGGTGQCYVNAGVTLQAGIHTWWVQTWNSNGYGPWSSSKSFGVIVPPGKATLLAPSGNIGTNPPTYSWNAVMGSTWYYLWVNRGSTNVIKTWYSASAAGCPNGTGQCSINTGVVQSAGDHTWWVQTWNSAGYGPWSDPLNFTLN